MIHIKRTDEIGKSDNVMYCDNGDTDNIEAVETSDYILSDFEGEGILFAYDK